MENQNPQYQNNNNSVTTSLFTLWDSTNGNQLRLSAMDNGIVFAIWIPVFDNGTRKYPKENRISAIANLQCVCALCTIVERAVVEYDAGRNFNGAIFTNSARTSLIEIAVENGQFFFKIHKNCDPVSHVPQSTYIFKFDTVVAGEQFNSATGDMEPNEIQADFYIFAHAVSAFAKDAAGLIGGHGERVANRFFNKNVMDHVKAIATAVHAQLPAPQWQRSQNGGYSNDGTNNPQVNPSAVTQEVNSLTDLL